MLSPKSISRFLLSVPHPDLAGPLGQVLEVEVSGDVVDDPSQDAIAESLCQYHRSILLLFVPGRFRPSDYLPSVGNRSNPGMQLS